MQPGLHSAQLQLAPSRLCCPSERHISMPYAVQVRTVGFSLRGRHGSELDAWVVGAIACVHVFDVQLLNLLALLVAVLLHAHTQTVS